MIITYLIIYSVMVYGISNAFVYFNGPFGVINRFREWISSKNSTFEELFSCMFCLPTNIGILLSIISVILGPTGHFTPFTLLYTVSHTNWLPIILFDGFFTGAIVYLIHTTQQYLEYNNKNE